MKQIYNLIFLLFFMVFPSCTKLPVYSPKPVVQQINDEVPFYDFYDIKSKLRYTIQKADSFIYFILETEYRPTQFKILKNGIRLAIDPEGKKNETLYLQFPLNGDNVNTTDRDMLKQGKASRENYLIKVINNLSSTAVWKEGEKEHFFTMDLERKEFDVKITSENNFSLKYSAQMPISYFLGRNDGILPTVGILIEGLEDIFDKVEDYNAQPSQSMLGQEENNGDVNKLPENTPEGLYLTTYEEMLEIAERIEIWFQLQVNK